MSLIRQVTVRLSCVSHISAVPRFLNSVGMSSIRHSLLRVGVRQASTIHGTASKYLWPSMTYWPPIKVTDIGDTIKQLENARNGSDVLRLLSSAAVSPQIGRNPELLRLFCRSLTFKTYIACEKMYPYKAWMKRDIHLAFEQLNSAAVQNTMAPILEDPQFKKMLLTVDESFESLTGDTLSEILMLLLYLGVDKEHMLLRKIYLQERRQMDEKSWSSISDLLHAAKFMGRADYTLYAKILTRIKSDLEDGKFMRDQCEMRYFLKTVELCPPLFSLELCAVMSVELSRIFSNVKFMKDAQNIADWTKAMAHIYKAANMTTQVELEKCLMKLHEKIWRTKEQFSFLQIGQIMRDMDKAYPANAPPLFSMSDYVTEASLHGLEVKDLLVAVAFYSVEERRLEIRLRDTLQKQLVDHYAIKFKPVAEDFELILRILFRSRLRGSLRDILEKIVYEGFSSVLEVDAHKVTIFIPMESNHILFFRELVANWENSGTITNRQRAIALAYLLAADAEFDAFAICETEKVTQNCDIVSIAPILRGLRLMVGSPQFVVRDIEACIQRALEKNKEVSAKQVTSLNYYDWLQIVFGLCLLRSSRTNAIGINVMKHLEKWMQGRLTYATENLLLKILIVFNYCSPHIMEYVSQSVLQNVCDVTNYQNFRQKEILFVCAHFVYRPRAIEKLCKLALTHFAESLSENNFDMCINILSILSALDIFPRNELQTLFSLENIMKVYRYCEENPQTARSVVRMYSQLNFSVRLLRPELGIKRILDGMQYKHDGLSAMGQLQNESIYSFLVSICGGSIYVQRNQLLFEVPVTFLVGLDQNGKPLPVGEKDFVWSTGDQRIAILSLDRKRFAVNNKSHLLFKDYCRKRHLVAIGCDVIMVMRNDWLKASNKQRNELRDAIFHCQNRNQMSPIPVGK